LTFFDAARAAGLAATTGMDGLEAGHRGIVKCAAGTSVSGSVNMDEAFRITEGQSNRWDYGLGFRMNGQEFAVWIEPHSATSAREIDTMIRKLRWLKLKLATNEFRMLWKLTENTRNKEWRQYWWVTSGPIRIRSGTREANRLASVGINFPCRNVVLGRD